MKYTFYFDEAGRGALFGDIYVGGILKLKNFNIQVKDSKKLTPNQRKNFFNEIKKLEENGFLYRSYGTATNKEIDYYGIDEATGLATARCIINLIYKFISNEINFENFQIRKLLSGEITTDNLKKALKIFIEKYNIGGFIYDGINKYGLEKLGIKITSVIKGDEKIKEIALASIVAKVNRDEHIINISKNYPGRGFEEHKGYYCKKHYDNIIKNGLLNEHRKTYFKKILKYTPKYNIPNIICSKSNYQKPKILLHTCCGIDLAWPIELLKDLFEIYTLWYNPNIQPFNEHEKRYQQYIKLLKFENLNNNIDIEWKPDEFFKYLIEKNGGIKGLEKMEEKSERCLWCYELRLIKTAKIAEENNIEYFTTTLSTSPKKDIEKIINAGKLAEKIINYKSKFLFIDFKKNNGNLKTNEISKKYGLIRQNYCGCIWTIKDLTK